MVSSVRQQCVFIASRLLVAIGVVLWLGFALLPAVSAAQKASDASGQLNSEEVAAYRAEFGVSEAKAEANLATQSRGAKIVGKLERTLGSDYASIWFDNVEGKFVVPLATAGKSQAANAAGEAAVARNFSAVSLSDGDYRIATVPSSWGELRFARELIDENLHRLLEDQTVQTSLDPRTNAVVVDVAATANEEQVAESVNAARETGVRVEVYESAKALLDVERLACSEAGRTCDLPVRGGTRLAPDHTIYPNAPHACTNGFRANGNDGKRYILTAAHCIKYEGGTYWSWETQDTIGYFHNVGTATEWNFPARDWAKIDATGTWAEAALWPTQVAYWGGDHSYPIWAITGTFVGQFVCHSGITTGTSCGTVTHTESYIEDSAGKTIKLAKVKGNNLCAAGGDSGGPWFINNTAIGLMVAGSAPGCNKYTRAYFAKIVDAVADLGVNIAGSGSPEAVTDHNDGVQPYQAHLHGRVRPNNLPTNYRFEWGKTCYCDHSSEGSAGEGGGTVSKSKTATGLDPARKYKYRIKATNSMGTAYGADGYFTTPPAPPKAKATNPSDFRVEEEDGKATLNGEVNPGGAQTDYRFEWGTVASGEFPNSAPVPDGDAGNGISYKSVSAGIEGLKGSTEYHYRLRAENSEGTATGSVKKFTTPDWRPDATTEGISSPPYVEEETGKVELNGKVNPNGFATTYRFEWGTKAQAEENEFPNATPWAEAGSGTSDVAVQQTISGLKGSTEYRYRLVAESVEGKTTGDTKGLETPDWRPFAQTGQASSVNAVKATLNGSVTPRGFATTYQFQYTTWADFLEGGWASASVAPASPKAVGSGDEAVPVSESLVGLKPDTLYVFRVLATSVEGTTDGKGASFTTPPRAITKAASSIDEDSATLNATVNPTGLETSYQFEYGPTTEYGSKAPATPKAIGSGTDEILVSESLEGLEARTTHHFRVVATNSEGAFYGKDVEFSTWGDWSPQSPPNPGSAAEARLNDVSCPAANLCVAVGKDDLLDLGFVQTWDGSEWSEPISHAPYGGFQLPALGEDASALACPGTGFCLIAFSQGGAPEVTFFNPSSGELTYPAQTLPAPSESSNFTVRDIACSSATACTVVGSYDKSGTKTYAARFNGSTWSIQTTANPSGESAELLAVSCPSLTSCTAVGKKAFGGFGASFAQRWDGSSWSISETPLQAGGRLDDVACTAASACTAVGGYTSGGERQPLALRFDGSSWSPQETPKPSESKGAELLAVTCASSTSCAAVGRNITAQEGSTATEEATLALSWGGAEWAIQPTPNPEGMKLPRLTGVACSSSTACTAVGWAKKSASEAETVSVAERYE